tara:strand:- start:4693 stop:4989 length:297 start_codon:yes stop_codon:yes gene_type:complete
MQKVLIEITDDFVHFKQSGKICNRWNLKEVNKYTANTIGPKSAEVLVRFLQVWNEEEPDLVHTFSADVSERTPDPLVSGSSGAKVRTRKRRRRRRKTD